MTSFAAIAALYIQINAHDIVRISGKDVFAVGVVRHSVSQVVKGCALLFVGGCVGVEAYYNGCPTTDVCFHRNSTAKWVSPNARRINFA